MRSDPPLCPTRLFCWRQVAGTDADVGMLRRAGVWSQEGLRSLRAELPKREPCCVSLVMHAREHECVWGDTRACALAQARLWAAPPLEAAAAGVMRPGSFQVWFLSSDPAGLVDPQSAGADTSGGFLGVYRAADGGEPPGRTQPLGDSMAQVAGAGTHVLRCPAACSPGAAWVTGWREQLPIPSWAPPAAESTVGAWPWPVSARGGHRGQPELCTHVLTATLHVLLRPTLPGVYFPY